MRAGQGASALDRMRRGHLCKCSHLREREKEKERERECVCVCERERERERERLLGTNLQNSKQPQRGSVVAQKRCRGALALYYPGPTAKADALTGGRSCHSWATTTTGFGKI